MSKFGLKLAGIPIGIEAAFDSTKDFCKEYLTEQAPLFSVAVTQENIYLCSYKNFAVIDKLSVTAIFYTKKP